ncbi:MAG: hypothetical protein JSU63_21985 [Phycisphaerales bacterium]|nr:MAG: hypothetical protein JSU63_21985 [Phycisphaerales bacterium]
MLVIIGTLTAIAVPRYANFLARQQLDAAVRRVNADLAYAQRRAKTLSQSQTVTFAVDLDNYKIQGMPDPDRSNKLHKVELGKDPYNAEIVSADLGGDAEIVFDGFGVPDSAGTIIVQVNNRQTTITIGLDSGMLISIPLEKKGVLVE